MILSLNYFVLKPANCSPMHWWSRSIRFLIFISQCSASDGGRRVLSEALPGEFWQSFKHIPLLEIWFATFSAWFWQKKMKRSGWFKQCVLSTVLPRGSVRGERRAVGKMFLKRNRSFTRRRWRALSSLEIMRFYQSFVKRESWELRESPTWTTTACWMRQKVEAKVITWIFIRCTMQNIVGFILIGRYWRMNNG